jgi:hypothetical protein
MADIVDFSDDKLIPVDEILWSNKYAMPVLRVNGKLYMPDTGEYAGYYSEVEQSLTDSTNGKEK